MTTEEENQILRERLAEIREVWAGSEVVIPIHVQEIYAINLCKQMHRLACKALKVKQCGN